MEHDEIYANQTIVDIDIEKEVKSSFIDYSMSVITQRALPDVRDGLKPVHRRILYSMYNSGITPDKMHSKSAATVGDVLKYFHPHGDASVYDALVRLAQDFSMRYPLVDGHGNFGSVDGDPPAAMRYTEARLDKMAMELMSNIEKDTVDFMPNYDGRYKEPVVLPSGIPTLLLNGSVGIAVGMATNIPPHNLGEVVDAICCVIDNPDATLEELLTYIKGPDFPTGGTIMGYSGIRAAYATGRGRISVRSKCNIEELKGGRSRIIVTEIPYMVNKARLVESIADMVKDKRIEGISNVNDHSDRNGMKIVIDVKSDANPQVVLNQLYNYTQLQDTFSAIMLALVDGEPKILTLREMIDHYVAFQRQVVIRRTKFDLNRARKRAHILEGLKIAVDNIDEVVDIIRTSENESLARNRLEERFGLTPEQSQAIVDMRLGRLTGLERGKIENELAELHTKIEEYEAILASDERIYGIIKKELQTIRNKFADARRTEIEPVEDEIDIEELIENEECVFTRTRFGYIKRIPAATYRTQRRGGRGVTGMNTREEDAVCSVFVTHTHNPLLFFTDKGRVYQLKGYKIPLAGKNAKGTNLINLVQLDADEKVSVIVPVEPFDGEQFITMVTKNGTIKRMDMDVLSSIRRSGIRALNINEGDALISAFLTRGGQTIMIGTRKGNAVRFPESEIRVMGRNATGVRGIKLSEGDEVVGAVAVNGDELLLTVSRNGYGKRTPVEDYNITHRGGSGVKNYGITEKTGEVAAIRVDNPDEDLLLMTSGGTIIRTDPSNIRICGRASQGVILMRTEDGEEVTDVAGTHKMAESEEEE